MAEEQGTSVSQAIIDFLKTRGVENAFGVIGGPIAHFVVNLAENGLNVFHCKHEGGAAFAALEASLASRKPALLFVTTGPGFTNALTGILSARGEGAKLLVMSGVSPVKERGRFVSQDTSSHSFARAFFGNDAIFDFSTTIEHPEELSLALLRIEQGFSRPTGFVAHLGLTAAMQKTLLKNPLPMPTRTFAKPGVSEETAKQCVEKLASGPFAIWAGFGALSAWQEVRTLVEVSGAPLLCTPRAKGIVPASHPNFVGMTGLGREDHVESFLERNAFDHVLVLGTRLGEASSFWTESYSPKKGFIHVDLNPRAISAAYMHIDTFGVQAEIQSFLTALLSQWKGTRRLEYAIDKPKQLEPDLKDAPVRPSVLMKIVQREIVDNSDAPIFVDVGNAFSFSNRYLEFSQPNRYRVHFDFGAMGSAAAGVLGLSIGAGKKAVAIVGDGAFLMHNEINTAVRYGVPCVWIVLNDARYGMVAQGMEAFYGVGNDKDSAFPFCDFVQIARGMGADGIRVETEHALADALKMAMQSKVPFVVDVMIDKNEQAPSGQRFISLVRQAGVST